MLKTSKENDLDEKSDEMPSSSTRNFVGSGFGTIKLVSAIVLTLLIQFWKLCTTAALVVFLIFWFQGGIVASITFFLAIFGLFYYVQDMLLYHPNQPPMSRLYVELPSTLGLPFENHFLRTQDGVMINAVFIPHVNQGAATLVFFHGNAGNIGNRLLNAYSLYNSCGFNILMVEYRGYGKSQGTPSEHGFYLDSQAAMDFLIKRPEINKSRIIVFGRSLGGGVAVQLLTEPYYSQYICALILENTFTSIQSIGGVIFKLDILKYVPQFLIKNKFANSKKISSIRHPTLFISGLADNLIPPKMMEEMYQLSGSSYKRMVPIQGGSHNDTWMSPGYFESIANFVHEVVSQSKHTTGRDMDVIYSDSTVHSV